MFIGIDGCKKGWILALIDERNRLSFEIISDLVHLKRFSSAVILIDMPIGFPEKEYRRCDIEAKGLLGSKRGSSVFFTPHKRAVYASSHLEANLLNKQYIGKGISIQVWNICAKIKQLNEFINEYKDLQIRESHPELCFYVLNDCKALLSKKSTSIGIAERKCIIHAHSNEYLDVIDQTMMVSKRVDVKIDDILDATIMAIRASTRQLQQLPRNLGSDGHTIVY